MELFPMHAWHPMLVHFPVGFLVGGLAVELAGWLTRRSGLRRAGLVLLTAGVLLALPAIVTGLLAYDRVDHSDAAHALMRSHRNLMLVAIGLFSLGVIWRWRSGDRVAATRVRAGLYSTLLAVAAGVLVIGADRGAALVFGHAIGLGSERLEEVLHERESGHGHSPSTAVDDHGEPAARPPSDSSLAPAGESGASAPEDSAPREHRHDDQGAVPHTH